MANGTPPKKGFLGQDWSWENLKGKFGDIASDPGSLTASPWFQGGMGLLSASRDARVDPFQAFSQGLQTGKTEKQADEDRKRIEELRKKLGILIAAQIAAQQGGQDPDTPAEQAAQMSMIPGAPGSGVAPGSPGAQQIPPDLIQQLMQSRAQ
jgi:hypothetical protein